MLTARRFVLATFGLAVFLVCAEVAALLLYHSTGRPLFSNFNAFFGNEGRGGGVCGRFEALGLYEQAELDFRRYRHGMTPERQAQYRSFCARVLKSSCLAVTILKGRVFVKHFFPGYQTRHRATIHAINRVAQRFGPLPDAEFVIEVTDGFLGNMYDLPIFMITRPRDVKVGILYPDFTFYTWPEAACPPERSHGYGYLFALYEQEAQKAEDHPEEWWNSKEDVLFWRGGRIANPRRDMAVQIFQGKLAVDMQFMEWKNTSITGVNGAPGCVGLLDHCQYRYLAFLDGNTYSSRFKYNLLCGSCVFASRPSYVEWWSRLFKANEDYVEVRPDWRDAPAKHFQTRWSEDGGRQIAESSRRKALELLNEDAVDCYWLRLIELAATVLPPPAEVDIENLPPSTKPIEDVLLYTNDVIIDEEGITGPVVLVR